MNADEQRIKQSRAMAARRAVSEAGGLLTEQQLAQALGISRQALASRRAHDKLPKPLSMAEEDSRIRVYTGADLAILEHEQDRR